MKFKHFFLGNNDFIIWSSNKIYLFTFSLKINKLALKLLELLNLIISLIKKYNYDEIIKQATHTINFWIMTNDCFILRRKIITLDNNIITMLQMTIIQLLLYYYK